MAKGKKQRDPKRSQIQLRRLKPHPQQAELFDELPPAELKAMAIDMATNGLQHAIDVMPDFTILRGHKRVAAAKSLGWKTIEAVIRHDLVGEPLEGVVNFVITDNLLRQQLGPLAVARCFQMEQALSRTGNRRQFATAGGDLRDRLAKRYGLSGRQMQRYVELLRLPRVLQAAVDQGRLPMTLAARLLNSSHEQEVADAVEAGADPKVAAKEALGSANGSPPLKPLEELIWILGRKLPRLELDQAPLIKSDYQRKVLVRMRKFINQILSSSSKRK